MIRTIFFAFVLFFTACNKSDSPINNEPSIDTPTTKSVAYLALGDSYTIGESVGVKGRFPMQFVSQLRDEIDSINFEDPLYIATTGWRTDQLIAAVESANLQDTFDLVSLLIGVNNQFQGRPIDVYKTEFTTLLSRSIELAQGDTNRVFVLSIPDYAFTPYGQSVNADQISAGIDAFNAVNKEITQMMGVRYFDITPISRQGVEEPELVAFDDLHPSIEQYRRWVAVFYDTMKAVAVTCE